MINLEYDHVTFQDYSIIFCYSWSNARVGQCPMVFMDAIEFIWFWHNKLFKDLSLARPDKPIEDIFRVVSEVYTCLEFFGQRMVLV